jgi:hypothetical protein
MPHWTQLTVIPARRKHRKTLKILCANVQPQTPVKIAVFAQNQEQMLLYCWENTIVNVLLAQVGKIVKSTQMNVTQIPAKTVRYALNQPRTAL